MNYKYEVYESNGGTVTMYIFDSVGNIVFAHAGYNHNPSLLLQDIECLKAGGDPTRWDNNGLFDGFTFMTWADLALDVNEVYSDDVWESTLIANEIYTYPDECGYAGRECLRLGSEAYE